MINKTWGWQFSVDVWDCNHDAITSKSNVEEFSKTLVKKIDMVAFGNPQVVDFGSGNKAGFTLVQLIETSNICAHFSNDTNSAFIDVFSCKPYDPNTIIDIIDIFFGGSCHNILFRTREIKG